MRSGLILLALFCSSAFGAEDAVVSEFKAPAFPSRDYFKKQFEQPLTGVDLKPPVHLTDYVVSGKLELSLRSYLDLVMANNTDITIQKLSLEIPKDAIMRAFSIFDPNLFGSFTTTRTLSPANDVLAGAAAVNSLNQPVQFRYSQMLPTGTIYNASFSGGKSSTNSAYSLYNPALTAGLNLNLQQPLLRGRGAFITKVPITIARSRLRQNEYAIEDQILQLVQSAEGAYWDVVSARESLRVQEQGLILADTSLKRAQRELELGAISPLDIYQPQAQYANYQILVSQARFYLQQTESALRRQIGADLDPDVRNLPIVLTESVAAPAAIPYDHEALVEKALKLRPDLRSVRQNLDVDNLSILQTKDALRPDLRLTGQYGASGRGGPYTLRQNVFNNDGSSSTIVSTIPGGFNDALSQLFGFGYPVYGFGLSLSLPIRDRKATADYADAIVNKRLDSLRVRSAEQNARLSVLNAISQVESSRASVELAKVAVDLAQKRAEAEQKKYDLGTTTLFFLLDAQTALNQAQSNLVTQTVNLHKNITNLLRFTGELLPERGIVIR